ncbi:MAG TPA: hypothetical protein VE909_06590 [Xanthobacteraceae bacterium]|nr:hypothetical protein [Xanthobacteraceae bacterium]
MSFCTHTWRRGSANRYVITVPQPTSEADIADFNLRDRLWRALQAVKQDSYGVSRYTCSAAGCDYGKYE